jgi:hypothetical protein
MESLLPLLVASAPRALFVVLFVVGLVMALTRRGRHPVASRLAVIAFVLLLAREVVAFASQAYIMSHIQLGARQEMMPVMTAYNLGGLMLGIVGTTLLVLAVFADRNEARVSAASPATTSASH